jgi:peptidyl-dipeptidase A
MWSQTWGNLWDIVEPYKGVGSLDVDKALVTQGYDEVKMVKTAENFFTSLGLDPLPATFWERSLLKKPADREVECHASAWDVHFNDDLRIKMCIQITEEELGVVHHELGHNYYFLYYKDLPNLFRGSAHDGFHEAIGDSLVLSMTPGYLHKLGLLKSVPRDRRGLINVQMKRALSDVAFLPFGRLIDQWRWSVFAGTIKPEAYNQGWWDLRARYQGVAPPVARSEDDFDPGAKFHIPANYPYTAYFLAHILQYQLHQAMCRAAGQTGPLHECSIFGSKEAGAKLRALLELGASKPWPVALEAMTGQRTMDASALLEYYAPLHAWLKEQNRGQTCGW